ncbi:MAG: FecR family protein [Elusimicrobiota bacterium]
MSQFLKILFAFALIAAASAPAAAESAWLVEAQGAVEVSGPAGPLAVKLPLEVPDGAQIRTGSGGIALLMLNDGSKVQIRPDSSFAYQSDASQTAFSLMKGAFMLWARHQVNRRMSIRVPGAVASVRGTVVGGDTNGKTSHLALHQGELGVTDSFGAGTILTAGQRLSIGARGLAGTGSLPRGTATPAEPAGVLPANALKPGGGPKPGLKPKKDQQTNNPPPPLILFGDVPPPPSSFPPPPPPSQTKAVVSPSSP